MSRSINIANAPVSYGAFELTVGRDANVPDGIGVLDQVAAAGYEGIDLGPAGYLGLGTELAVRLATRKLALAGAYLELPFADEAALGVTLPALDQILDIFDGVPVPADRPPPRPTLADAGSDARRAHPGRSARDRGFGHDAAAWRRFGQGLARAVRRCRERGYEPTFHHETGTYVEAPWEIERVLEVSDIGLCLDTGHLLLGGGEPVAAARQWAARINHVHLKDARRSVMAGIVADDAPVTAIWSRDAFVPLGTGDLDLDGVVRALRETGYGGWLVVEQDVFPTTAARFGQAAEDQRSNRARLARLGL